LALLYIDMGREANRETPLVSCEMSERVIRGTAEKVGMLSNRQISVEVSMQPSLKDTPNAGKDSYQDKK